MQASGGIGGVPMGSNGGLGGAIAAATAGSNLNSKSGGGGGGAGWIWLRYPSWSPPDISAGVISPSVSTDATL